MPLSKSLMSVLFVLSASILYSTVAHADTAAEMAKKLQNPLTNIKAVMFERVRK